MNSKILANDEISGSIEPSGYLQSSVINNRLSDKKDRSSSGENSADRKSNIRLPNIKKRETGSPDNDSKAAKRITFDETAKDISDKLRSNSKGSRISKYGRPMVPPGDSRKFTHKSPLKSKLGGVSISTTIAVIKNRPDPVKDEFEATKNQFSDFESQTKSNLTGTQFRLSNPKSPPPPLKPRGLTPKPQKFVHNVKMSKHNLQRKLQLDLSKTDPAQLSLFTNPKPYPGKNTISPTTGSRRLRNLNRSITNPINCKIFWVE